MASGVERLTEGQAGRRQHRHVKKEGSLSVAETKGPSKSNRRWQNICEEDVCELMPVEIAIRPPNVHKDTHIRTTRPERDPISNNNAARDE